jgi:5,10-methylenetetrahydromethanopterin reductase
MEFWSLGHTLPTNIAEQAALAERRGWDGLLMPDTQNIQGDAFVALTAAAAATTSLRLGTGVTNPYTRHPAVAAAAIASVQALSGGRAVFGVGRGDSSLAHIGLAPASPARLRWFVAAVQRYLRAEAVCFEDLGYLGDRASRPLSDVPLAGAPADSRLLWLDPSLPKVPVDVAATGPTVIGIGALLADRLTFAVGADPTRLAWAMTTARQARDDAGLDPEGIAFGAYINVVAHPDTAVATRLAATGVTTLARFSAMNGHARGPVGADVERELVKLTTSYDMREHGNGRAAHRHAMSSEGIAGFGIVGPAPVCVERLQELEAIGLDRAVILGGFDDGGDRSREHLAVSAMTLEQEVMPACR